MLWPRQNGYFNGSRRKTALAESLLKGGGGGKKAARFGLFVGLCANLAPKKITVLSWCTWLCFTSWEHQCALSARAAATAPTTHAAPARARTARTQRPRRTATGRWRARSTVLRAHTQRDPTDVSRTLVTRVFALSLFRICYLSGPGQFFFPTTTHTLSPK